MNSWLRDKRRWEQIRDNVEYTYLRDILNEKYEEIKNQDIPPLRFSLFLESIKTGNRFDFENLYFKRREMLSVYTLMSLVYSENSEYIAKLEDVICAILEEYTWSLPAHLPADKLNSPCHIDLFAAETGLYMAEIKYVLFDRLSPLVIERITEELDRRIVSSFKNNSFIFEETKSNWAAVCGGSVGATLLYENLNVYMEVKSRIEACMSNYLESIDSEGVSSEGIGYLQYGLIFYLIYNDLLKNVTFNRIDNIKIDKLNKTAQFMADMNMSRDVAYSFADAGDRQVADVWFINYLKKNVNDELPAFYGTHVFSPKTSVAMRNFLMYEPIQNGTSINKLSYYKNFGCVVSRCDTYAIGIKAGHNQEEHNHNDVGSFAVVANNKQLLCDLGAPLYTMQSLKIENYDNVIERSSFGHNVPIINGIPQKYGREYFGEITVDDKIVKIDLAKAYPVEINKLNRIFELKENEIILSDEFDENVNWQERFVTEIKPEISDGKIKIECMTMFFDETKYTTEVEKVDTKSHSNTDRIIYTITLTPKVNLSDASFKLVFDEGTRREEI